MSSLRIATWNVLHGAPDHVGPADPDALVAAVASLDADVLALQEVDRGQARSGGVDQLALVAGGHESRFLPALVGTPGGDWRAATDRDVSSGTTAYGVGLVVRRPVRAWHALRLRAAPVRLPLRPPGGGLVWFGDEPRVALAAELDDVTVACTHLSFVPGWNVAHLRRVVRWAQALPGPRLVLGDLNVGPRTVRLAAPGWRALGGDLPTFPAERPRRRIDHVLGNGPLPAVTGAQVRRLPLSDHRALVVDLG